MNEAKPDAEVELSAQDLLELAAPCESNVDERKVGASVPPPRPRASAPAARRVSISGLALSFVLLAGAVGVAYLATAPGDRTEQSVRLPQSQLPAAAPASAGEPVRFTNPFDAKEVFEFPAGTSNAEARDAVAEILMQRAMERQRKFDARVSSNR